MPLSALTANNLLWAARCQREVSLWMQSCAGECKSVAKYPAPSGCSVPKCGPADWNRGMLFNMFSKLRSEMRTKRFCLRGLWSILNQHKLVVLMVLQAGEHRGLQSTSQGWDPASTASWTWKPSDPAHLSAAFICHVKSCRNNIVQLMEWLRLDEECDPR